VSPVKALLVDDVPENLVALEALLRPLGLELLRAASGTEALELLLAHDVALALIDVQMPGMDGFELAELMRGPERTRGIPIIFLTAGRDPARAFAGYEAGAVDFLYKPLDPRVLVSKVKIFVELYRQRQQLAEQVRQLEENVRLVETFMAVLGHDLRSPLAAILNQAEILRLKAAGDDDVRLGADRIWRCAKRISHLTADVLDLARTRRGPGLPLAPAPCDLADVVARVVDEQEGRGAGGIEVVVEGDPHGTWDAERLVQLLANLVSNAIEHRGTDEPVRVEVDGRPPRQVRVGVHNGGHIPAEAQATIFEPFRSGRRAGDARGLGLGLFIVKQIAEAHGGRISLESTPATGTTFTLVLPRETP
jgi:signal transduction histidine kinase